MKFLQSWIHRLEEGGGLRHLKLALVILALIVFWGGYNLRAFRNMWIPEAMDSAQLARNLAEGRGYTTLFIRPFSMFLVSQATTGGNPASPINVPTDPSRIKNQPHPDISNPPAYPLVLAGLMKVLPFRYPVNLTNAFWSVDSGRAGQPRQFYRYQPDFLIALFNQVLFLGVIGMTFVLARRLFDPGVAWMSALVVLGTELLWRFSVSGLSTIFLLLEFMCLVWCLVALERDGRDAAASWNRRLRLALATGGLLGLGCLTRYSFGWLIVPVVIFLVCFGGQRRMVLAGCALVVFAVVITPWVIRNVVVSDSCFGTAGYAVLWNTADQFREFRLERSLQPTFESGGLWPFWYKFLMHIRNILQTDLPRLGGAWVTAFFLAGLLVWFRDASLNRLRGFVLMCLAVLMVTQALGRTALSDESPEVNSENLLVLLAPLVIIFGVSLFFLLLEQLRFPMRELRLVVIGAFAVVACQPMLFTFLPPRQFQPVSWPPYQPPTLQQVCGYMKPDELLMSDIPWAVAWYGNRQCVWFTLDSQQQFIAVDDQKQVKALYLSPQAMDGRLLTQLLSQGQHSWGNFIVNVMVGGAIPATFPLREANTALLPAQLFFSDWKRWRMPSQPSSPSQSEEPAR